MNQHHLLYPRQPWNSHFATRNLRQKNALIVPIEEEIHEALHREVPVVPLLDHYTALTVRRDFTPYDHYRKSMDNLVKCIDVALRGSRVQPIQRELGQLTIHALELQKPYLEMGAIYE